ncbi:purine-nucleoside phosphorylase [bacterium]|nr:purine-nucleoside phosphorylase [bacterium]
MTSSRQRISKAALAVRQTLAPLDIQTGIILGSGLGSLANQLKARRFIETTSIQHWPRSTVPGHSGRLVIGYLESVPVIALQGRVHYYEGYSMEQVVFPVRVLGALGIKNMIITNAAGALNPELRPGSLMLIADHINLMGDNPLIGFIDPDSGSLFTDMSAPYDPEFRTIALNAAKTLNITLNQGVLAVTTGPSYETAAEVRMLRTLGGDAVCMSTVPEVIAAVQMGLRVLGISCITNMATGLSSQRLSHEEVKDAAGRTEKIFFNLITAIVQKIDSNEGSGDS